MTLGQAVKLVDRINPNTYPTVMKVQWISKLDGQIHREVYATHEDNPLVTDDNPDGAFHGYDEETPMEQVLLVPFPYDEDIYSFYLKARINQENRESAFYNQNIELYNAAFTAFQSFWNREHMPIQNGPRFRF